MPQSPRPPSPCIQVCRLTACGTLCEGCGRTVNEIAGWSRMSETERDAVWQRLSNQANSDAT